MASTNFPVKRKFEANDEDEVARPNPAAHVGGTVDWMRGLDEELVEQSPGPRVIERLGHEINALNKLLTPDPVDEERRLGLIACLRIRIQRYFAGAEVHLTGSTATHLYLPDGDIDVTVTWDSAIATFGTVNAEDKVLSNIKGLLESDGNHGSIVYRSGRRVPVVNIIKGYGFYNVDITFGRQEQLRAIPFVERLLRSWPVARPLILLLKLYLKSMGLNDPVQGGIGGLTIVVMVGSFLLTQNINFIQFDHADPGNWGQLFIEMCHSYGDRFDFKTKGISFRQGGIFNLLPDGPEQLFVESPTEEGVNMSKRCRLFDIQQAFRRARAALMDAVNFQETEQTRRNTATWAQYIRQVGENDGSLLHSVLGLDAAMMNSAARAEQYYPVTDLRAFLHNLGP